MLVGGAWLTFFEMVLGPGIDGKGVIREKRANSLVIGEKRFAWGDIQGWLRDRRWVPQWPVLMISSDVVVPVR